MVRSTAAAICALNLRAEDLAPLMHMIEVENISGKMKHVPLVKFFAPSGVSY